MIKISIYKKSDGVIIENRSVNTLDEMNILDDSIYGYVEGHYDIEKYKCIDDEIVAYQKPAEDIKIQIRRFRDALLAKSDWTQNNDSPLSETKKQAWATYRQALRDLPSQYNSDDNITDVIFPTIPE